MPGVVAVEEVDLGIARGVAVLGDDRGDRFALGEESRRSIIEVDVGHGGQDERGADVDEGPGVQGVRCLHGVADGAKEPRAIAGMPILAGPERPDAVAHRWRSGMEEPGVGPAIVEDHGMAAGIEHQLEVTPVDGAVGPPEVLYQPVLAHGDDGAFSAIDNNRRGNALIVGADGYRLR